MRVLDLPQKKNLGVPPHKRCKWGEARNYTASTLLDAFVFYKKEISYERYKYYMNELKRIERRKNRG